MLPRQGLYLLLVTNKGSNILEDLETLRLLAKVRTGRFFRSPAGRQEGMPEKPESTVGRRPLLCCVSLLKALNHCGCGAGRKLSLPYSCYQQ